jgi:hypothetical protein
MKRQALAFVATAAVLGAVIPTATASSVVPASTEQVEECQKPCNKAQQKCLHDCYDGKPNAPRECGQRCEDTQKACNQRCIDTYGIGQATGEHWPTTECSGDMQR